jgi:hypothetical protein
MTDADLVEAIVALQDRVRLLRSRGSRSLAAAEGALQRLAALQRRRAARTAQRRRNRTVPQPA